MNTGASYINRQRAAKWHEGAEPWSLADWSNAIAGEVGELANIVKKMRRIQTETLKQRADEQDMGVLRAKALKEVADIAIYLDLMLEQLDPDAIMDDVIADKFNETSREFGFTERLDKYHG
jgi:NTP pyrophosphatase (non-canonical NTP hydrolase)